MEKHFEKGIPKVKSSHTLLTLQFRQRESDVDEALIPCDLGILWSLLWDRESREKVDDLDFLRIWRC